MKITAAHVRAIEVPLSRPYTIHRGSCDHVAFGLLELRSDDGHRGHGQASPAFEVTGESAPAAVAELQAAAQTWLLGRDPRDPALAAELAERCRGPAARAAVDMALLDLEARAAGSPLVERLGRVHRALPTSITIGIKPVAETLIEADEYLARGFTALKVKIGDDLEQSLERLERLRQRCGPTVALRVDANQGCDEHSLHELAASVHRLSLEMIEQPLPRGQEALLRTLPAWSRERLCADESVHGVADLQRLLAEGCPFGIVNIKLMKCGGPRDALRLAKLCAQHKLAIMWGCNDESVLGIAAALHVALACPATRYLDLDGSLDLDGDPYVGGFTLDAGRLQTLATPGLGAEPRSA